jgi:signal transduction histidine kinase
VHSAVSRAASEHGRTLEQLRIEYDRKQEDARNAVIAAERSRLLHDLHDGMGSQLITALRMTRREEVPRDEVARVIEDSLDDMRLIIDSLDIEERDLLPLLGNLRYRLEPRLHAIGIALIWEVEPLPELDYLTPETGLAIVRIVQEAVNNAVRHGAATTITVRARASAASVELSITDNGHGFDTERSFETGAKHRGLHAMRARAQKLSGTLAIESGPGGTKVELALPLQRQPA